MTINKKARALRRLGAVELSAVAGGGILLITLGQTRDLGSQVALEEVSITFEGMTRAG